MQQIYDLPFNYSYKKVEVNLKCQISYLPIESRIDRVGFDYLLIKTIPQHLVFVNQSQAKATHMRDFITANKLNTSLEVAFNSSVKMKIDTSIK